MEAYLFDSAQLIFRYFHIVAAIAWIGASFYFVWLDNNLQTPPDWKKDKGIKGDLWAIHGGGFYEVAKYTNGPEKMPETLHWFKWEAYTTWLTGFLLFSLIYYVGAEAYLIDANKQALSKIAAIGTSFGLLIAGWLLYEGLCRLPVKGIVFCLLCIVAITGYFYGLNQLFAQKAAYLQTGALIGTCMAANVFFHIMPSQRYMVKEISENRIPDSAPGLKAKNRSVHNNYATLPVLFLMMSGHFAFITGREHAAIILMVLIVCGMWIRHYFNLKHQGQNKPWVLQTGIGGVLMLLFALAPWPLYDEKHQTNHEATQISTSDVSEKTAAVAQVTDEAGMEIIKTHCQSCHSQNPSSTMFSAAPLGFTLDSVDEVFTNKEKVILRTLTNKDMPLGNMSQMTMEERDRLGQWLEK